MAPVGGGGALTFLFTDIEGSTQRWERAPDAMKAALARHDELLRAAIAAHSGTVFATGGDGVAAVFDGAADAAAAALDAQAAFAAEPWPEAATIRVRMGLHTGHAEQRDGDFFGPTLNRTARLMSVAHGGQVVCSRTTAEFLESVPLVDLGSHRLRDLLAPVPVVQVGGGSFPPLRSLDTIPSNLPTFATELVGRTDDIAALAAEVRANRVVTLTGVGGVGKTRLALAVAAAVAPDFPDGCWLVELAPVADAGEVAQAVAGAVATSALGAADRESVVRYLEMRKLLVVLDNCEHLLDECAALVDDIVAATPDVRIVTTSREPLGVDGEVVRRVRSLALPEGDTDIGEAATMPAVRLFVERGTAASDDFRLTDENVGAVIEICRHLDGIPLAIELAAARVRAMAPMEIAARLEDRFRVLTGGRRAQERHRTLQAAVAWSYDLLSEDDREVFAQLSVFPSSFDLDAAAAVVDVDGLDGLDVVDVVVRLVDRSLVVHDATTGRYRMLETLRQFGADRLAEMGGADATRDRFVGHHLRLVQVYGPGMWDSRHDQSVATLVTELDNLRATIELLMRDGRWDSVVSLCTDGHLFFSQIIPGEGAAWLGTALDHHVVDDPAHLVRALETLALCSTNAAMFEAGRARAGEALAVAREHCLPEPPWAHFALALVGSMTGDPAGHRAGAEQAVRAAEVAGDEFARIAALSMLVLPDMLEGRQADAERGAREAVERAVALQNRTALSVAVICRCSSLLFGGHHPDREAALELLDRYADRSVGPYGGMNVTWLLSNRAVASAFRDPAAAVRYAIEAVRYADRAGSAYAWEAGAEALALSAAVLGLTDAAVRLAASVDSHPSNFDPRQFGWLAQERNEALRQHGVEPPPAAEPMNRRELFALVAEIERQLP